jgi:glutaconyl-CoA decarboxylase
MHVNLHNKKVEVFKMDLKITVNGVTYAVEVEKVGGSIAIAAPVAAAPAPKAAAPVAAAPAPAPVAAPAPKAAAAPIEVAAGDTSMKAPMPGKVSKVVAKVGDKVKKGDVIMILEAMKMQNEMASPVAGTVKAINASNGDNVKPGQLLAVIG